MTATRKLVRLPADLAEWLKVRSVQNDRSENKEIINIIRAAMSADQTQKETNQ